MGWKGKVGYYLLVGLVRGEEEMMIFLTAEKRFVELTKSFSIELIFVCI
jgi:hypothetical protein